LVPKGNLCGVFFCAHGQKSQKLIFVILPLRGRFAMPCRAADYFFQKIVVS